MLSEREKRDILYIGDLSGIGFLNRKTGNKTGKYIFKILIGNYFYLKIIWRELNYVPPLLKKLLEG